jgi:TrmH family RNA methyltransferase
MYSKFLVEGDKAVRELLHSSFSIDAIYGLSGWVTANASPAVTTYSVNETELLQISTHDKPNQVMAVADIPMYDVNAPLAGELYIACDQLNDPGNAGTIIRIADWFGIRTVIFSEGSVDVYNPKTVSAAKGSLFRVKVIYNDLKILFNNNKVLPVIAAAMDGENIYHAHLPNVGILLIGNEANGINEELYQYVSKKISIPSYGNAESLNAGVATGIIVSEWRRKMNG